MIFLAIGQFCDATILFHGKFQKFHGKSTIWYFFASTLTVSLRGDSEMVTRKQASMYAYVQTHTHVHTHVHTPYHLIGLSHDNSRVLEELNLAPP